MVLLIIQEKKRIEATPHIREFCPCSEALQNDAHFFKEKKLHDANIELCAYSRRFSKRDRMAKDFGNKPLIDHDHVKNKSLGGNRVAIFRHILNQKVIAKKLKRFWVFFYITKRCSSVINFMRG